VLHKYVRSQVRSLYESIQRIFPLIGRLSISVLVAYQGGQKNGDRKFLVVLFDSILFL
jgi:hypothetical protein